MKTLLLGILAIFSVNAFCERVIVGDEAQQMYEAMNVHIVGPHCTGACFPGIPCDPTCTRIKQNEEGTCYEVTHSRTHVVDYECHVND